MQNKSSIRSHFQTISNIIKLHFQTQFSIIFDKQKIKIYFYIIAKANIITLQKKSSTRKLIKFLLILLLFCSFWSTIDKKLLSRLFLLMFFCLFALDGIFYGKIGKRTVFIYWTDLIESDKNGNYETGLCNFSLYIFSII